MGPPSMNGGRENAVPSMPWRSTCFNGAAVDERRKVEQYDPFAKRQIRLQWGRRR